MYKLFFASLVFLANTAPLLAQSPWTYAKGGGYAQAGYNMIVPTRVLFYDNTAIKYTNRKVYDNNIQGFGDYGITDNFNISMMANVKYVATGEVVAVDNEVVAAERPPALILPAGKKWGFGNGYYGLKYKLYDKGWVVSGNFTLMTPVAANPVANGLETGFDCWGFAPSVSVGNGGAKWYAYANAGANFRTGAFSHEWAATGEYGYKIKSAYIIANIHARYSLNNQPALEFLHTGLGVNQQNYLALGLKAFIPFNKNWGLNVSAFGALLGNNVQAAPSFGMSVFYKW